MRPQITEPSCRRKGVRARIKVMESNVPAEMLKRWSDTASALLPPHRLPCFVAIPVPAQPCWSRCWMPIRTSFLPRKLKFSSTKPLPRSNAVCRRTTICCPFWKRLTPPRCSRRARLISNSWNFRSASRLAAGCWWTKILHELHDPVVHSGLSRNQVYLAMRDPRDVVLSSFMQAQPLSQSTAADLTLEAVRCDMPKR